MDVSEHRKYGRFAGTVELETRGVATRAQRYGLGARNLASFRQSLRSDLSSADCAAPAKCGNLELPAA
jgi:hypothetical protein